MPVGLFKPPCLPGASHTGYPGEAYQAAALSGLRLHITPEEFDEVAAELGRTLDHFGVPPREDEVLAAFAAHKGEVTEGSMASA
jgi:hemoglobin